MIVGVEPARVSRAARARGRTRSGFRHGLEQNFINQSEKRLDFVCQVIKKSTSNSLVLFRKIAYGEKIYNKLRHITDKKVYYVDGSVNVDIREEFKSRDIDHPIKSHEM
jgi:hypothetical protein